MTGAMAKRRDDFAWIVELMKGTRRPQVRIDAVRQGYESVDQIFERRTRKKKSLGRFIILLIELLPFIMMFIYLFLLS